MPDIVRSLLAAGVRSVVRHGQWGGLTDQVAVAAAVPAPVARPVTQAPAALAIPSTLPPGTDELPIVKPGCTAADESILVHGHLAGLANGQGGFGLLRESKKHLDRAVKGAQMMGDAPTARRLALIAEKLPEVRDEEAAEAVAEELEELLPITWQLGVRCGGTALPPELLEKVTRLAQAVKEGKISREQAVAELRDSGKAG